ncbi:MAG: potassium transporter TrkA [Acidimicrobiales bacterium]
MAAISSLLFVMAVSLVITRVATVILAATGMSAQSARFQARSAFTGAGFTTSESERVVDHPLRRRVIMTLMLLGNVGIVAAASTLILGFKGGAGFAGTRVLELVAGMMALVFLSRSRWVDRRLTALISRVLKRYTDLAVRDVAGLLNLSGSYAVSELAVSEGDWVSGRALVDLALRDEGVVVLGITRSGGAYLGAPVGSTTAQTGTCWCSTAWRERCAR